MWYIATLVPLGVQRILFLPGSSKGLVSHNFRTFQNIGKLNAISNEVFSEICNSILINELPTKVKKKKKKKKKKKTRYLFRSLEN